MFLNIKLISEFPTLLKYYRAMLRPGVFDTQFEVLKELSAPPTPSSRLFGEKEVDTPDMMDMKRMAAIFATIKNIRELERIETEEGKQRMMGGAMGDPRFETYRTVAASFIASVTRTFSHEKPPECLGKEPDMIHHVVALFLQNVLEYPLRGTFEHILYIELFEEDTFALTDVEWAAFKELCECILQALSMTSIAYMSEKSFYHVGFNTRFGSLVSFRNEKARRLRQATLVADVDELKQNIGANTAQIKNMIEQMTTLQNMALESAAKLDALLGNKKSKKS